MNDVGSTKLARQALLPWWISLLSWMSLVYLLVPVFHLFSAMSSTELGGSAYGLEFYGSALDPRGIVISAVLFAHGVAGFGLLWSKSWGVNAAIGVCSLGLAISLYTGAAGGSIEIGFAPVLHVLVLLTLTRLRRRWAEVGEGPDLLAVFD